MEPVDYEFKVIEGNGAILEKKLNELRKEYSTVDVCSHVKDGAHNIVICKGSNEVEYVTEEE